MIEILNEMDEMTEDFFRKYLRTDVKADAQALIDHVITLSKIYGERVAIFTTPGEERFTRCDIGFGSGAYTRKGWGDDLHERSL